jgi:hypothetical protein
MNHNQKVHLLPLAMLFMYYASVVALGQGMCVPEPVKVGQVKGQVFFGHDGKQRPQQGVTVEVTAYRSQKRVIASTVTDAEGHFYIDDIRPGKYWLRTKHNQIIGIDVELNIVAASDEKKPEDWRIVFVLGADPSKMCGGGHVEVVKLPEGRK